MDIVKHYEQAKVNIIAEKNQKVAIIKDRILREIQPKYAEIEKFKAEALNQLNLDYNSNRNAYAEDYNSRLVALQNKFENDKKAIVENAENKKTEVLNLAIQTETYEVEKEYTRAVADLDALISKLSKKE